MSQACERFCLTAGTARTLIGDRMTDGDLHSIYDDLAQAVEAGEKGAVDLFAAFLLANRGFHPAMRWFTRAVGFSASMNDSPPELLAIVGVGYHHLGELFVAARMFDKSIQEGGARMCAHIGDRFASIGDHTAAETWFLEAQKYRGFAPYGSVTFS
jgi:hypothetical protein